MELDPRSPFALTAPTATQRRNALLAAARFAPSYPETDLGDPAVRPVMTALHRLLEARRPYPALVVDRFGDLVAGNDAAALLTEGCGGRTCWNHRWTCRSWPCTRRAWRPGS